MSGEGTVYLRQSKPITGLQGNDMPVRNDEDDSSSDIASASDSPFGLKRRLGLPAAISLNVGSMIGSGIFLSPKGVLLSAGSVGLSLVVWAACGVISMLGALCYAELGLQVGKSGGDYAYLLEAYGRLPAFIYMITHVFIMFGSGSAIQSITCGEYLIGTFIQDDCIVSPTVVVKLAAVVFILLVATMNIYSVNLVKRSHIAFTITKVIALMIIIIGGLYYICIGRTENFTNAFEGSVTNPGKLALSFYSGMWAYIGWDRANVISEELVNVKRDVPLSIIISVVIVTVVYVMTNLSYFAMVTTEDILASHAVALTWANRAIPSIAWMISFGVAISNFGGSVGSTFGNSRKIYRGSREGMLPRIMGYIHATTYVPLAAVLYIATLIIIYIIPGDIQSLMDMVVFVYWVIIGMVCGAVLVLRYRRKNQTNKDLFQVPLIIPIIMVPISIYFIVAPVVDNPRYIYLFGIGTMVLAAILYLPMVHYNLRVPFMDPVTKYLQLFLQISPSETLDADLVLKG